MAGQGIQRREVLRILGTAAAAAQFPGFSKWAFACGHVGNAALQIKPAVYRPQFFTAAEYAMVERLAEIIIPSDGTPGAKEAGVAEFIDFMVASDPESQYAIPHRADMAERAYANAGWKAIYRTDAGAADFPARTFGIQRQGAPAEETGRQFFRMMREYTVTGFYTSEIGYKELDNPALKFYAESPECPHKDDPEHLASSACAFLRILMSSAVVRCKTKSLAIQATDSWPSKSTM